MYAIDSLTRQNCRLRYTYIHIFTMVEHTDEELAPSKTEGFKVGEKKTIDEVCDQEAVLSR